MMFVLKPQRHNKPHVLQPLHFMRKLRKLCGNIEKIISLTANCCNEPHI